MATTALPGLCRQWASFIEPQSQPPPATSAQSSDPVAGEGNRAAGSLLLRPQRLHGIDGSSAPCRNPARNQSDCDQKGRHNCEGERVVWMNAVEEAGNQFG